MGNLTITSTTTVCHPSGCTHISQIFTVQLITTFVLPFRVSDLPYQHAVITVLVKHTSALYSNLCIWQSSNLHRQFLPVFFRLVFRLSS
jgi:hypothetical protein